jgi:hypothetical protein
MKKYVNYFTILEGCWRVSFGCLGVKDMCIFHSNLTIKPSLFFFYVHVFLK